jgi:hypothetical protein
MSRDAGYVKNFFIELLREMLLFTDYIQQGKKKMQMAQLEGSAIFAARQV